eukprot:COSAG02_NODE_5935_length_3932_cov_2.932690_3_plen_28_part_01
MHEVAHLPLARMWDCAQVLFRAVSTRLS